MLQQRSTQGPAWNIVGLLLPCVLEAELQRVIRRSAKDKVQSISHDQYNSHDKQTQSLTLRERSMCKGRFVLRHGLPREKRKQLRVHDGAFDHSLPTSISCLKMNEQTIENYWY
eukprot:4873447-Amphidinium_carterae.1